MRLIYPFGPAMMSGGGTSSIGGITLKESQVAGTYYSAMNENYTAFKFTPALSYTATHLEFLMTAVSAPTGNVYALIYANNSGTPASSALTTSTAINVNTLEVNPTYGWVRFTLSTPTALTASTIYWLVARQDVADGYASLTIDDGNVAYGNSTRYKGSDGANWTIEANEQQLNFKIYDTE